MLSPVECERLQTLPDGYTAFGADGKEISNSRRYLLIGNGWCVETIKFLFSELVMKENDVDCLFAEMPMKYVSISSAA